MPDVPTDKDYDLKREASAEDWQQLFLHLHNSCISQLTVDFMEPFLSLFTTALNPPPLSTGEQTQRRLQVLVGQRPELGHYIGSGHETERNRLPMEKVSVIRANNRTLPFYINAFIYDIPPPPYRSI